MADERSFFQKYRIYLLIALLAVLIGGAVWKSKTKKKGEEVTVEKVQKRTIREMVSASGKIFPETEVKISADVSGEIVELTVKEGDSVRVGQILGKIRPDEYASAVERGEAAVKSAEAQREISSSNVGGSNAQIEQMKADRQRIAAQLSAQKNAHQRNIELKKTGFLSQAELENSESSLKSLEASLAAADAALDAAKSSATSAKANVNVAGYGITSARATLKELRTSLAKTNIVAPVSGIVSKLNVEKGERVVGTLQMAGTEMLRVANLHTMEVQVDVSENDILKVTLGDVADIEVDAYLGRKFKGTVTEIANSASNLSSGLGASLNTDQVTNFIVKVRVMADSYQDLVKGNIRYPFRPGMSASVDIYTNTAENVLSVPLIAVTVQDEDKDKNLPDEDEDAPKQEYAATKLAEIKEIVYIVKGDSAVVRVVKSGIQDNDFIQILSGLEDGETVVSGPYSAISRKLKKGAKIQVVDKDALKKEKEKKEEAD